MQPATRFPGEMYEEYRDINSLDAGTTNTGKDPTRQEFKDDADVNVILRKFGVTTNQRVATFGEVDYNIDLQQAFAAVADAKQAHKKLPENLRRDYPTWQSLLNAIERGEITFKEEPPPAPQPEVTPPPPTT